MRRRWIVALSGVTLISLASAVVPSAATSVSSRPADAGRSRHSSTATSRNGETLGRRPSLAAGRRVELTVGGFAADAAIELRIACRPEIIEPAVSDGRGRARIVFTVPRGLPAGVYRLVISGPAANPVGHDAPRPIAGNVEVDVPRVAFYPFSVRGEATPPVSAPPPTC